MGTFAVDLKAFADKANARANAVVRKIVLDIGTELVYKSPVGDAKYWTSAAPAGYVGGRFRANWQFAEGSPDIGTTVAVDASGQSSIDRIGDKIPADALGKVFFITNSLPYSIRLEEGWSYRQAPHGMVALTVQQFRPIVEAAARAIQ